MSVTFVLCVEQGYGQRVDLMWSQPNPLEAAIAAEGDAKRAKKLKKVKDEL